MKILESIQQEYVTHRLGKRLNACVTRITAKVTVVEAEAEGSITVALTPDEFEMLNALETKIVNRILQ